MTIKIILFSFLVCGMGESFVCPKSHWSFVQVICFFLECFLIKDQIVIAWNKQLKKGNLPLGRHAVCMYGHMPLEHCNYFVLCFVREEAQSECPHDSLSVKRFCALILIFWQMIQQQVSFQGHCGYPVSSFCAVIWIVLQKSV